MKTTLPKTYKPCYFRPEAAFLEQQHVKVPTLYIIFTSGE